MFQRRLWWFLGILGVLAVGIVARLISLQVVYAGQFEDLVERVTPRQTRFVRPPRGAILDRTGRILIQDEPSSDVTVFYRALTRDDDYLRQLARAEKRAGAYDEETPLAAIVSDLRTRLDSFERRVADLSGRPVEEIVAARNRIVGRVERIRADVLKRSPRVRSIREENQWHPLIEDLDHATALSLQMGLVNPPWMRVQPGSQRIARDADSVAQLLGRLGAALPERIEADPLADDEFRQLRPGDRCGVSGVERLAETTLRGARGRIVHDYARGTTTYEPPLAGDDVTLTLHVELQEQIYDILAKAAQASPHPSGAAAVVIDVATREVLAAASYPTFKYSEYRTRYRELARDTRYLPLKARAIQLAYPPGSTCKAIAAVGALADGAISPETRIHCTGHLLPNITTRFRCWIYNQFQTTHDASENPAGQNAADALRNSCNIYFFRVGEKMGATRLCEWFDAFGLGRSAGTGLIEEAIGVNPTPRWLEETARRGAQPSDAWNWSIGQGEVTATPLQVANVGATIASGLWAPVVLARDSSGRILGDHGPGSSSLPERALRPVREGMWRVVNERGATAHPHATMSADTGYVLCGKTGSAQAQPAILNYRFVLEWPDGQREERIAATKAEALEEFEDGTRPEIVGQFANERFPALAEGEKLPAHAWFMGYTQSADTPPGARPRGRCYAIAVLVEFGASGGRSAGPAARQIAELMVARDWTGQP